MLTISRAFGEGRVVSPPNAYNRGSLPDSAPLTLALYLTFSVLHTFYPVFNEVHICGCFLTHSVQNPYKRPRGESGFNAYQPRGNDSSYFNKLTSLEGKLLGRTEDPFAQ